MARLKYNYYVNTAMQYTAICMAINMPTFRWEIAIIFVVVVVVVVVVLFPLRAASIRTGSIKY